MISDQCSQHLVRLRLASLQVLVSQEGTRAMATLSMRRYSQHRRPSAAFTRTLETMISDQCSQLLVR